MFLYGFAIYNIIVKRGRVMEIDIRDDSIVINGDTVGKSLDMETIKLLLGEPRIQKNDPDKNYREYMESRRGKDFFEKNMSLVWDELGLYSHTDDGKNLASLGFVFNKTKKTALHTPKNIFTATLTINGVDWLDAVKSGTDMFGNYSKLDLKSFIVFAEYTPDKMPLSRRTKDNFTLIEINHAY